VETLPVIHQISQEQPPDRTWDQIHLPARFYPAQALLNVGPHNN
jgi:hypothetical protein